MAEVVYYFVRILNTRKGEYAAVGSKFFKDSPILLRDTESN